MGTRLGYGNCIIKMPPDLILSEPEGKTVKLTGTLTNNHDNIWKDELKGMEYYYHRGIKYFFRSKLFKFIMWTDTPEQYNLKFKQKYNIEIN